MLKLVADTILTRARLVGIKMQDIDAANLAVEVVGILRNPTPEMLQATPNTYRTEDGLGFVGGDALGTWQKMIDAILAGRS